MCILSGIEPMGEVTTAIESLGYNASGYYLVLSFTEDAWQFLRQIAIRVYEDET